MSTKSLKFNINDFEQWRDLYKSDPDAFEALRAEVIQQAHDRISQANKGRMRALQNRLDLVRERAVTPLKGAIEMHKMLCDNAIITVTQLYDCIESGTHPRKIPAKEGVIVEFTTKKPCV